MNHKTFISRHFAHDHQDECYLVVDDLGVVVCRDCQAFHGKKSIVQNLKNRYEKSWQKEYKRIKRNKRRARSAKYQPTEYTTYKDGKLIAIMQCYE